MEKCARHLYFSVLLLGIENGEQNFKIHKKEGFLTTLENSADFRVTRRALRIANDISDHE